MTWCVSWNYADLLMIMARSTGSPFSILTASKRPSGVIQYGMPEMYTNLSLIIPPPFTKSKQPVDYTGCFSSVKSIISGARGKELLHVYDGRYKCSGCLRIPREEHPCILADFRDERIYERPSLRLGIDRCKMGPYEHVPYYLCSFAGVNKVVDQEPGLVYPGKVRAFQYICRALLLYCVT